MARSSRLDAEDEKVLKAYQKGASKHSPLKGGVRIQKGEKEHTTVHNC